MKRCPDSGVPASCRSCELAPAVGKALVRIPVGFRLGLLAHWHLRRKFVGVAGVRLAEFLDVAVAGCCIVEENALTRGHRGLPPERGDEEREAECRNESTLHWSLLGGK